MKEKLEKHLKETIEELEYEKLNAKSSKYYIEFLKGRKSAFKEMLKDLEKDK